MNADKRRFFVLVLALCVIALHGATVRAQPPDSPPPLPADLLFVTNTETHGDYPRNTILRVDAGTLELSPFFVDTEADELIPLSWSPDGNLLAVYRLLPAIDDAYTLFPRELCIVNRDGELQRCMDDGPPMHWGGFPDEWPDYYPVAWGADGQTIFFDTEYVNENSIYGYGRRLIEASAITGETLRVVYDYPETYAVTASPDLNHISVGFEGEWMGEGHPLYVLNLLTGVQVDIPSVVPAHTAIDQTCLRFSPQGSYVTVSVVYDPQVYAPDQELDYDWGDLLLLIDPEGVIQDVIGEPQGAATLPFQSCPGWQPNEQAIVFSAGNVDAPYIVRYSLASQETMILYELGFGPGREPYVYSPLILSPDGTHIALTVSNQYYDDRQVAVLYPDGEIYRIPSPYRFGLYPLWVPPLDAADGAYHTTE